MASYPVIRPIDLVKYAGGMLLPNQINRLNSSSTTGYASGWTTGLTSEHYIFGSYVPVGWNKPIPSYAAYDMGKVCYGLNSLALNGATYSCIPMSADSGNYTYATIPYYKYVQIKVYEDIGGSCNFEYFYFRYNGTDKVGKTWSSISGSWTGTLGMNFNAVSGLTNYGFCIHCGGMNTSRRVHYSDNVISPGTWIYVGKYSGLDIYPGDNVGAKTFIYSGVTRYNEFYGTYANYGMNFAEYFHRVKSIAIAIGYSSTPSKSNASSGTYDPTWNYSSNCTRYSCTCNCNYQACVDYTL